MPGPPKYRRPLFPAEAVSRALHENDVCEYPEADRRFHHAFNWLAGNTILTDAIMGLREKMLLYFSLLS
jgi:DNA-binding GntR family transcriptional regulator